MARADRHPARVFRDFRYRTLDSWSCTRRGVGKAEHTPEGANPRFIVTSLKRTCLGHEARALYEELYRSRRAENRIGEQFTLFAIALLRHEAGQSAPHVVLGDRQRSLDTLRRVGLRHAQFADAAAGPSGSSC